jgi:hypothetical protein
MIIGLIFGIIAWFIFHKIFVSIIIFYFITGINILGKILSEYNDGISKNYFCIAVALLDIKYLNASMKKAESKIKKENIMENDLKNKAKILKNILSEYAEKNNIEIKLQK